MKLERRKIKGAKILNSNWLKKMYLGGSSAYLHNFRLAVCYYYYRFSSKTSANIPLRGVQLLFTIQTRSNGKDVITIVDDFE